MGLVRATEPGEKRTPGFEGGCFAVALADLTAQSECLRVGALRRGAVVLLRPEVRE